MRVLVVEDSEAVARAVGIALRAAGCLVTIAGDCVHARDELKLLRHDLAIIDLGLPDGSGNDLCRETRSAGYELPILILSARDAAADRVAGLDAGADDYLGKPFVMAEVVARVRALGRRGPHWKTSSRTFGDLVIDRDRRSITRDGVPVALTPREFEIVTLLAWRDGRVASRDEILESVWGESSESAAASLEVLITRIRRKLGSPEGPEVIRTLRQVGYAWARDASRPC